MTLTIEELELAYISLTDKAKRAFACTGAFPAAPSNYTRREHEALLQEIKDRKRALENSINNPAENFGIGSLEAPKQQPTFDQQFLSFLWGKFLEAAEVPSIIEELTQNKLLEDLGDGRFCIHENERNFARLKCASFE